MPYDPNIDDDASPEEVAAWFNRSPDDIQAAKDADWAARWRALRLPDDEAYEPEDPAQLPGGDDETPDPAFTATGDASPEPAAAIQPTVPDFSAYPDVDGPPAPPIDPNAPNGGQEPWPGDPGYVQPAALTDGGEIGSNDDGTGTVQAGSDQDPGASQVGAGDPGDDPAPGDVATALTGDAADAAAKAEAARQAYVEPTMTEWKPQQHAVVDAIIAGEKSGADTLRGYRYIGKQKFVKVFHLPQRNGETDYSQIPDKVGDYTISRFGKAQFGKADWDRIERNHPDIRARDPDAQDRATWYYAAETYHRISHGRDLTADASDPSRYPEIAKALKGVWPSLPGGGQQGQTQQEFNQRMVDGRRKYTPRDFDPSS